MKIELSSLIALALTARAAFGATFTLPSTTDIWLAGMPDGSTASINDSAPAQSPLLVTGITIAGGTSYRFSASGSVSVGPGTTFTGPDGDLANLQSHWISMLTPGPENGIAGLLAPANALIGVFLSASQPSLNPPPSTLDFASAGTRDYVTLWPALQQPFFIGDGLTGLGVEQQVIAPVGATRLFIGIMDNYGWYNNQGQFTVQVVPEPGGAALAATMLATVWVFRKRNQR